MEELFENEQQINVTTWGITGQAGNRKRKQFRIIHHLKPKNKLKFIISILNKMYASGKMPYEWLTSVFIPTVKKNA